MFPTPELKAVARRKVLVRQRIAGRRAQAVVAVGRLAAPLGWLRLAIDVARGFVTARRAAFADSHPWLTLGLQWVTRWLQGRG